MPGCAVASCKNHSRRTKGSAIKYFTFPRDPKFCEKWIDACQRGDIFKSKHAHICSIHFEPGCLAEPSLKEKFLNYTRKNKRALKPDAVPTLNLHGKKNNSNSEKAFPRAKKRKISINVTDASNPFNRISEDCTTAGNNLCQTVVKEENTLECTVPEIYERGEILEFQITNLEMISDCTRADNNLYENIVNEETNLQSSVPQKHEHREMLELQGNYLEMISEDCTRAGNNLCERIVKEEKDRENNLLEINHQREILKIQAWVRELEQANVILQGGIFKLERKIKNMEALLGRTFTPGQIKKLLTSGNKRVVWSREDITSAISLHRVSPKAYCYLLANGHPLPALSTLRKWAFKYSIKLGVLNDVKKPPRIMKN